MNNPCSSNIPLQYRIVIACNVRELSTALVQVRWGERKRERGGKRDGGERGAETEGREGAVTGGERETAIIWVWRKTKLMIINKGQVVHLPGHLNNLETVQEFTYLR